MPSIIQSDGGAQGFPRTIIDTYGKVVGTDVGTAAVMSETLMVASNYKPALTQTAPFITSHPVTQTVNSGAGVSFSVVASGPAPFTYQWKRNGIVIDGATAASYSLGVTALTDNGALFSCAVDNAIGSTESQGAYLYVQAVAPTVTTQPQNQTVTAGAVISLSVVVSGTAPFTYQWRRNGVNIGTNSPTYTPSTAPSENGAIYSCSITNIAGTATSNNATLTVNYSAPAITAQPSNQSITELGTATFTITATGTAPLTYQWKKNGTNISGATASTLSLPAEPLTDNGATYACTVSTAYGSITSNTVTLTVTPAATPLILIVDTTKAGTGNTTFSLALNSSYNYSFAIDWGDGNVESNVTGYLSSKSHTYSVGGVKTIKIWANTTNGFPALYFAGGGDRLKLMQIAQWGTSVKWSTFVYAFQSCGNLTITATDEATALTGNATSFQYAFNGCTSLTSFPLLDVHSVTTFATAWAGCTGLLSFAALVMTAATDCTHAWDGCTAMTSFGAISCNGLAASFQYAWQNCNHLVSFPVISVPTATQFQYAWSGCSALTSFPALNFPAATSLLRAWAGCNHLTSFGAITNTNKVNNFTYAWYGCTLLASFPLIDTSACTDFTSTWDSCPALTSFPLINTSKATSLNTTWNGCTGLTSFPLIDTSKVTNFNQAWQNCTGLNGQAFPALNLTQVSSGQGNYAFAGWGMATASYDALLNNLKTLGVLNTGIAFNFGTAKYSTAGKAGHDYLFATKSWALTDGGKTGTGFEFIITVDTTKTGTSNSLSFQIPSCYSNPTHNYTVDWGDGNVITYNAYGAQTHAYATGGVKTIKITENIPGGFPGFFFNGGGDSKKLLSIEQWGVNKWLYGTSAFYGCANLVINATDSATANFASVTDMSTSFYGCTALTSFPALTLTACTNLSNAWYGCTGLTSFPYLTLPVVQNLSSAWQGCTGLTSFGGLGLTSSCTNLSFAWNGCNKLTSFPSIYTNGVSNFQCAWQNCSALTSFPAITTITGQNFASTWNGCTGLAGFAFPLINMRAMTSGASCFDGWAMDKAAFSAIMADLVNAGYSSVTFGANLCTYNTTAANTAYWDRVNNYAWTISAKPDDSFKFQLTIDTSKTGSPGGSTGVTSFRLGLSASLSYDAMVEWGDGTTTRLNGTYPAGYADHTSYPASGVRTVKITECSVGGFPQIYYGNGVDTMKVMAIANWGLNKWTNFNCAFYSCANLVITATDSATANFGSCLVFSQAFNGCTALTGFPLLDTHSCTNFNQAWQGCSALTSFPALNMAAATTASQAWRGCFGLTAFPLLLNTNLITDFSAAWYSCTQLTSFPLLNTIGATNMSSAWYGCTQLTSFPLLNTASVTTFNSAWWNCNKLTSFPLLNTANGTNFVSTWWNCTGLSGSDFPTLNMGKSTNGTTCFTNVAMSAASLSALIVDIAARTVANSVPYDFGSTPLDSAAVTARDHLVTTHSWSIVDGGAASAFVMTVNTGLSGSANTIFILPLLSGQTYNFKIDWGDGQRQTVTTNTNLSHTYAVAGPYSIKITENVVGGFPTVYFNGNGDYLKLIGISRWGTNAWTVLTNSFYNCSNLAITATDAATANTGNVTAFNGAFLGCTSLTAVPALNMANGTNFNGMFYGCTGLAGSVLPAINLRKMTVGTNLFYNAGAFTPASYSALLVDLAANSVVSNVTFNGYYNTSDASAAAARATLVGRGWTLTDMGGPADAFVMVVDTTKSGTSGSLGFNLVGSSSGQGGVMMIDWGDGTNSTSQAGYVSTNKTYATGGRKTIRIRMLSGAFQIAFPTPSTDPLKLMEIQQWGTLLYHSSQYQAFYGCANLTITATDGATASTGTVTSWSAAFRGCTSLASFPTLNMTSASDLSQAWYGCTALTSFSPPVGLAAVTTVQQAWYGCTALTSFPLIALPACTSAYQAWYGCTALTSFAAVDLPACTSVSQAWYNCTALTSFPLIDLHACAGIGSAWYNCTHLTGFPALNLSACTDASSAWYGCTGLTSFGLVNLPNCTNFNQTWWNCTGLENFDFPLINMRKMTNGVNCFTNVKLSTASMSAILLDIQANTVATAVQFDCGRSQLTVAANTARETLRTAKTWVIFDGGLVTAFVLEVDLAKTGGSAYNILVLPLDGVSSYNFKIDWGDGGAVQNVTTNTALSHTYSGAGGWVSRIKIMENVVGGFPTIKYNGNATDRVRPTRILNWGTNTWATMNNAFNGCYNLTAILATDSPVTGAVTNFANAFSGCTALTSFPVIDTSAGTDFTSAWYNCSVLTSFPLLNTAAGTIFTNAWYGCVKIAAFAAIDTSNGTTFTNAWNFPGASGVVSAMSGLDFPLVNLGKMTAGTGCFQGWSMSTASYSAIINLAQSVTTVNNVIFDGYGTRDSSCAAAYADLTTATGSGGHGWTIRDMGLATDAFTMVVDPSKSTNLTQIATPATGSFDYLIDWGDGHMQRITTGGAQYANYPNGNLRTLRIRENIVGGFPGLATNGTDGGMLTLKNITQWGTNKWLVLTGGFKGCANLDISATDLPNFSALTSLANAFQSCSSLTNFPAVSLPLCTSLTYAWADCVKLTSFGAITNTVNVTNLSYAWYNCNKLAAFPMIDTSAVTNTQYTWGSCTTLEGTAFPALNLAKVTTTNAQFNGWRMSPASYAALLINISGLTTLSGTTWDGGYNEYDSSAVAAIAHLRTTHAWTVNDFGLQDSSMMLGVDVTAGQNFYLGMATTSGAHSMRVDWGDGTFGTANTTDSGHFSGQSSHTYATAGRKIIRLAEASPGAGIGISSSYTDSNVGLKDLMRWGTFKIRTMNSMFNYLAGFNISATDEATANTAANTDMYAAFNGCTSLTRMPLIDTSNVTNMTNAWTGCTGLTSFPALNTAKVTAFTQAWSGCTGLNGYAFPTLNMRKVTNASGVFTGWAMTTAAYSAILVDIAAGYPTQTYVAFDAGTSKYLASAAPSRAYMTGAPRNWSITDGGVGV